MLTACTGDRFAMMPSVSQIAIPPELGFRDDAIRWVSSAQRTGGRSTARYFAWP